MNKRKLGLLVGLVVILIAGFGLFFRYAFVQQAALPRGPNRPLALRKYVEAQLPRPWRIQITGTPGTPVVVGYRVDGWRSGIVRGVIPTNFMVHARARVELAIKNVGSTKAQIGYTASSYSRGPSAFLPFYGFSGGATEDIGINYSAFGSLPERELTPLDWPVTLPPGMTKREAEAHDFFRDRAEVELKEHLERLAKSPQDHILQAGLGHLYFKTQNKPAAESAFERFFHSDCKDPTFMNVQLWSYVETFGGTNLQLAYEVGQKMVTLAPDDPYLADTVGWILFKLAEYEKALPLLELGQKSNQSGPIVKYHLGMAYYMSMHEDEARKTLRGIDPHWPPWGAQVEAAEVKKCLEMLDFDSGTATRRGVARVKQRLAERSDDPVAGDRLARVYESRGCPRNQLKDPVLLKAIVIQCYRLTTNGVLCWYPKLNPPVQQTEKSTPAEPEIARIVNDGRDGSFHPTTNTVLSMADRPDGIYRFSSVDIPTNVSVTFMSNSNHKPVVWLVQSNYSIQGTVDVSSVFRGNPGRTQPTMVSIQPQASPPAGAVGQGGVTGDGTPNRLYRVDAFEEGAILIVTPGELAMTGEIRAKSGRGFDRFEAPVHNRGATDKPDVLKIISSKSNERGDAMPIMPTPGGRIKLQEFPYRELQGMGVSSSDLMRFAASRVGPNRAWNVRYPVSSTDRNQ